MGQILSVLFFTGFTIIRFGHLVHHKTNRYEDLTEVYDTGTATNLAYHAEILGGFILWLNLSLPAFAYFHQSYYSSLLKK